MKNFRIKSKMSLGYIWNSDDYVEKYMKIKFNSGYELPLNKTIEIPTMTIVARAIFHENSKYYSQFFFRRMLVQKWKVKMN